MRYRYTVDLTVNEEDFTITDVERLRKALRDAAEEYADGIMPVRVRCEDELCISKNDARIGAGLLSLQQKE